MKVRKNKKATNTESALNLLVSQINKSGLTIDEGIRFANNENWGAFKFEWYQNKAKERVKDVDILAMSAASNWEEGINDIF
jgi:hypothetical protein